MRTFVMKLAAWHRLFKDLEHARLRLAQAEPIQPRNQRVREMQEDVRRLQRACDEALGELQTAADIYIAAGRQQIQTDSAPIKKQPLRSSRGNGLGMLVPSQIVRQIGERPWCKPIVISHQNGSCVCVKPNRIQWPVEQSSPPSRSHPPPVASPLRPGFLARVQ
jgi:hypothetical protein